MSLAREFRPGAITLDIDLPDVAGWTILDRLKHDPLTRHIPVHIITGDENRRRGLALGAMTYLEKTMPNESLAEAFATIEHSTQKRVKKLLVVCGNESERHAIDQMVVGPDLDVISVATGGEALAIIEQQYLDGIIIHEQLRDIDALQFTAEVQAHLGPHVPPCMVLFRRLMSTDEASEFTRLLRTSTIRVAYSLDQVLEECVLLLHRAESDLSAEQRRILDQLRQSDPTLVGKKVLVVDDDVRNIFALTSLLEDHHLVVSHAENGRAGIELLKRLPDTDLVLMDIMMPEMDGYETIRAIRTIPEFRTLPIIALTAKAMKGDRAKCIDAGASDYIMKPVDLEQLFSVLRVWIKRNEDITQLAATST
jgi:CheY-like chemotaxis protein